MDCWQALANAIIIDAAKEYMGLLKVIKAHPDNRYCLRQALDLEDFFHSDWYEVLTDVDPDYLIEKMRKEVIG